MVRPRKRGRRERPFFHVSEILAWIDAWREKWGSWPRVKSGKIPGTLGLTWSTVDNALRNGSWGLPGGWSLARLMEEERGVRNSHHLPELTLKSILAWADQHRRRTGSWPNPHSGSIATAPGETWMAVAMGLSHGNRGLPGGDSLARLLARERGVRNQRDLPRLTPAHILQWADAHRRRTGAWPAKHSGPIPGSGGDTWAHIDNALHSGLRGLAGGLSLARLLEEQRGVRNIGHLPSLTLQTILRWADEHFRRTGSWPRSDDGAIAAAPAETWKAVAATLANGGRGLPQGWTLPRLLAARRGLRNRKGLPHLTCNQILAWADAFFARTGEWPYPKSGVIPQSNGETWAAVDSALRAGVRGLPGGSSLVQLLRRCRKDSYTRSRPPRQLTIDQILAWAEAHKRRTGDWPKVTSGLVAGADGQNWAAVNQALRAGQCGLPGGSSLARLLAEHRGKRNSKNLPPYTAGGLLAWARAYLERTGKPPTHKSGPIPEAPGETWAKVEKALYKGCRGFPGGSSLFRFLQAHMPQRRNKT